MIDNSLKVQMYQSLEAVEQSTPMLKTAVIGSIKASPDNKQAHTGKEFAVNRSLQAMGDLLENLEKSPNINQVQQQESHFYTVIHQVRKFHRVHCVNQPVLTTHGNPPLAIGGPPVTTGDHRSRQFWIRDV